MRGRKSRYRLSTRSAEETSRVLDLFDLLSAQPKPEPTVYDSDKSLKAIRKRRSDIRTAIANVNNGYHQLDLGELERRVGETVPSPNPTDADIPLIYDRALLFIELCYRLQRKKQYYTARDYSQCALNHLEFILGYDGLDITSTQLSFKILECYARLAESSVWMGDTIAGIGYARKGLVQAEDSETRLKTNIDADSKATAHNSIAVLNLISAETSFHSLEELRALYATARVHLTSSTQEDPYRQDTKVYLAVLNLAHFLVEHNYRSLREYKKAKGREDVRTLIMQLDLNWNNVIPKKVRGLVEEIEALERGELSEIRETLREDPYAAIHKIRDRISKIEETRELSACIEQYQFGVLLTLLNQCNQMLDFSPPELHYDRALTLFERILEAGVKCEDLYYHLSHCTSQLLDLSQGRWDDPKAVQLAEDGIRYATSYLKRSLESEQPDKTKEVHRLASTCHIILGVYSEEVERSEIHYSLAEKHISQLDDPDGVNLALWHMARAVTYARKTLGEEGQLKEDYLDKALESKREAEEKIERLDHLSPQLIDLINVGQEMIESALMSYHNRSLELEEVRN